MLGHRDSPMHDSAQLERGASVKASPCARDTGARQRAPRARPGRLVWAIVTMASLGIWLSLVTWRLETVPGMSMDEAWSILSARGQWAPDNPLSGMTSYSGPFPVLLLRLLGTTDGVWILRAASVVANAATLAVIGLGMHRMYPGRAHWAWALAMIATCPVWLIVMRTGIEVAMFMPLLVVLGLYCFMHRTPRMALFGGLSWGLLVYNHLVGVCFIIGIALAWLATYRRWPPILTRHALLGGLLGVAPRIVAVALYHDRPLQGSAAGYSLLPAIGDLRWVPLCLWRTLHGDAVYLRYVGRLAIEPWPYWLLAVAFVVPWLGRRRAAPRPPLFVLLSTLFSSVLLTLAAPYLAVRFFVLPVIGLAAASLLCAAAAVDEDRRWRWPMGATVLGISALNLFYGVSNFYRPWQAHELGYTKFFLGDRSKQTGNWAYYPKETLVRELLAVSPAPQQIVTVATLERPLRVLLDGSPIRVALPANSDPTLRSVFLDYDAPDRSDPRCVPFPGGERCLHRPVEIADYFLMYPIVPDDEQAP
jgi:hypothetical protein